MCLGISSFDNIINPGAIAGQPMGSNPEVAGNFLNSIFGGMFSDGPSSKVESSGTVACLFGDLSLDNNSNGAGAGGEVIFGGGFSGGSSCGGGGGMSLA